MPALAQPRPHPRWVILAALAAFLLKLFIAANTYGTNDVMFYQAHWRKSLDREGVVGLYRDGIDLTRNGLVYRHEDWMTPPFVVHLLRAAGSLSEHTPLEFPFWLKLPSLFAEAGIVWLLWRLLAPHTTATMLALLLVALSPVSMMISGFHGSTDSVMVFFLLLSVWMLKRGVHPALAGLAFGMSVNIKVWPVLLAPAIFFYLPDMRRRIEYFTGAGLSFGIGSIPWLYMAPELILRRVLGYGSVYGNWGIPRIVSWLASMTGVAWFDTFYRAAGKYLTIGLMAGVGYWLQRRHPKAPLELRLGLLAALFLAVTSGFGVQYLAWLAPWVAFLGPEALVMFTFAASIFLTAVYNYWSETFPWRVANSLTKAPWGGTVALYEIICWWTVLALLFSYFWQLRQKPETPIAPAPLAPPTPPSAPAKKRKAR